MSRKGIDKALRMARRKKKLAEGGVVFDPDYLGKYAPAKAPNQRVMEGHQEFEQGYGPSGSMPWAAPRWRRGINSRGQEVDIVKAADGGLMDDETGLTDVPGVGAVPTDVEAGNRLIAGIRKVAGPSWLDRARSQTQRDIEAYQSKGVPGLLADTREASDLAGGFGGVTKGIRAYHGSPYDFEKFDLSRIGTGEGAQSYGHGLYFAENPAVAGEYKKQLSGISLSPYTKEALQSGNPEKYLGDLQAKITSLSDQFVKARSAVRPDGEGIAEVGRLKNMIDYLSDDASKLQGAMKNPAALTGRMYEVNINAKPEQFLDWDKPLIKQSPEVTGKFEDKWGRVMDAGDLGMRRGMSGAEAYNFLSRSGWAPESTGASYLEQKMGIPGIRYLDQFSRQVKNPIPGGYYDTVAPRTNNYVVFNPEIVDILKKYGIAGLGAGTALSNQTEEPHKQGGKISAALRRHKKKKG